MPVQLTIRLATDADAGPISTLLIANSAANGGQLFGDWSEAIIARWLQTGTPVVVAQDATGIQGVLFSAEDAEDAPPPVKAMFRACPPLAQIPYAYGPICVGTALRGQGIPQRLYALLQQQMGERRGVLFINIHNPGSLKAHLKLGMEQVGHFHLGEERFDVLLTPAVQPQA